MKKRFLLLILTVLCAFILFGCENSQNNGGPDTSDTTQPSSDVSTTEKTTTTAATTTTVTTTTVVLPDEEIESFVVTAEKNGLLYDVSAIIKDNVIYIPNSLSNLITVAKRNALFADITVSGGKLEINNENADGSLVINNDLRLSLTCDNGAVNEYEVRVDALDNRLPIININTNGQEILRDSEISCTFSVDSSLADGYKDLKTVSAVIRGRGHSTWKWDKRPYKITLDKSASVLGLPKTNEFILLANYCDKTFIRNITAYEMAKALNSFVFTETQIPVDVFLNGQYIGVYSLGQHLEVNKDCVNFDKTSTEADTDYLLEVGGSDTGDIKGKDYFHSNSGCAKYIKIHNPDGDIRTDEQVKYIIDYVNAADKAIVNLDNYEEYIDVDSFIDWFLMHELTYNLDSCFRRSCYMTKEKGGKLKMGIVWDFDFAFGNFSSDTLNYSDWASVGEDTEDAYIKVTWYNYLLEDENFRSKARARWNAVKDTLLSTAEKTINDNYALIYPSQQDNFDVWDILNEVVGFQRHDNDKYNTYDLQVKYLRDFIKTRAAWISEKL